MRKCAPLSQPSFGCHQFQYSVRVLFTFSPEHFCSLAQRRHEVIDSLHLCSRFAYAFWIDAKIACARRINGYRGHRADASHSHVTWFINAGLDRENVGKADLADFLVAALNLA